MSVRGRKTRLGTRAVTPARADTPRGVSTQRWFNTSASIQHRFNTSARVLSRRRVPTRPQGASTQHRHNTSVARACQCVPDAMLTRLRVNARRTVSMHAHVDTVWRACRHGGVIYIYRNAPPSRHAGKLSQHGAVCRHAPRTYPHAPPRFEMHLPLNPWLKPEEEVTRMLHLRITYGCFTYVLSR